MAQTNGKHRRISLRRSAGIVLAACAALAAAACDLVFAPPGDGAPIINVYDDRYEFRLRRYDSVRALRIALEATVEVPVAIQVHDCDGRDRLAPVLDMLRERGLFDLDVKLPENCTSQVDGIGADYAVCAEPRPDVCTREFLPVCAQRDTGLRCVTTPCESVEAVTVGNACTACSDPAVLGYYPGRCEALE